MDDDPPPLFRKWRVTRSMPVSPTVSEEKRFAMRHVVRSKNDVNNLMTASAVQAYANGCESETVPENERTSERHIVLVAKKRGGTAILEKAALSAPTCCASLTTVAVMATLRPLI